MKYLLILLLLLPFMGGAQETEPYTLPFYEMESGRFTPEHNRQVDKTQESYGSMVLNVGPNRDVEIYYSNGNSAFFRRISEVSTKEDGYQYMRVLTDSGTPGELTIHPDRMILLFNGPEEIYYVSWKREL